MPKLGKTSIKHYNTLHPDLQLVLGTAIRYVDFYITCGFRNEQDQNEAFDNSSSEVKWPDSLHNTMPSLAVDVAPCINGEIDWNDEESFTLLAGIIKGIALMLNIPIRLGCDWDGNLNIREHKFIDRPHIELILPRKP